MATLRGLPDPAPFRFLIKRDRDGRHRWYLYNASGTVLGMHAGGFPGEGQAYEDAEHLRDALAAAPIVREIDDAIVELVAAPGADASTPGGETGGGT